MKSTVFELKFPSDAPDRYKETDVKFPIPTLKAYAIEYSEFTFKGGFGEHKEMVEGQNYSLVDDGLIWHGFFAPMLHGMDMRTVLDRLIKQAAGWRSTKGEA